MIRVICHPSGSVKTRVGISNAIDFRSGVKAMMVAVLSENFFTAIFETHGQFPHYFRDIIAFPFDVVSISSALFVMIEDCFDFPSFFVIVYFGGGQRKLGLWISISVYGISRAAWNTSCILQVIGNLSLKVRGPITCLVLKGPSCLGAIFWW